MTEYIISPAYLHAISIEVLVSIWNGIYAQRYNNYRACKGACDT